MALTTTKNMRHGRLTIRSGDSPTRLTRVAEFVDGDFSHTKTKNVNVILDRGKIDHARQGDEEAISWEFTGKFVSEEIRQVIELAVWPTQSEGITGLNAAMLNSLVPTAFPYVQDSLTATATELILYTKVANGAVPTSGEFAEPTITVTNVEGLLVVPLATGFEIFTLAADTDFDIIFDAVGASTLEDGCSDVITYQLVFEILDPADPAVVLEHYILRFSTAEEVGFEEGDEFNTWSFSGIDIERNMLVGTGAAPA